MDTNKPLFAKDELKHIKAVIDYALALEDKAAGKKSDALNLLKSSLKNDPSYAPAALAAIKTSIEQGDVSAAEKTIKAIWKLAPNDELADIALDLKPQESSNETYRRLKALCDSAPQFPESQHLLAKAAISANHWPEARTALDKLLGTEKASKQTYLLLAQLEAKQKNDAEAESKHTKTAEKKPQGHKWLCKNCGSSPQHYYPICSECGEFDCILWASDRL
jgi:HemY protein